MVLPTSLQCVVVTPEKAVYNETVDFVSVPMYDGELGVLPGRTPLIGRLGYGELRTKRGTQTKRLFIDGGFVQIRGNVVTILTQTAIPETAITMEAASSALEETLQRAPTPETQQEQVEKQLRARAKLRLARRKQSEG